jgi:hypothetical protein
MERNRAAIIGAAVVLLVAVGATGIVWLASQSNTSVSTATLSHTSSATSNSTCMGMYQAMGNRTPSIGDLPVMVGLRANSTTAMVLQKANLTRIYLQTIHEQAFQQRVAGFVWQTDGWGPYLWVNATEGSAAFPPGDNQVTPQGVVFWFQDWGRDCTYFGQFFGAYDLVTGNYTFSLFHPHPTQLHPP